MQSLLEIDDIACRYGDQTVVDGLSLHVNEGALTCLLGPSGCGKTTALRAIAGFEPVHRGCIRLGGGIISCREFSLPPEQRHLGMVFQDYALFPHLSVKENICFGLRGASRPEQNRTAARLLELVGLEGYGPRYPHELSGGQQQRVAVARALAPQPRMVLLDEPFSNLDVDLRERLGLDVRDILKEEGTAAIFVTHDQYEAFMVGERVGVMREGRILQWDTPYNLYHEPVNRFVADFIGQGRIIRGTLQAPDTVETGLGIIRGNVAYPWAKGSTVEVLLRPDDIFPDPAGALTGTVVERAFRGAETLYTLRLPDGLEVLSLVPSRLDYAPGEEVRLRLQVDHFIAFRC